MKIFIQMAILSFVLSLLCEFALADEPFIYPSQGQSQEQMEKDKYDCYEWAKKESGFDPMAPPTATSPPPPQSASGGIIGRRSRARQEAQKQEQWEQQQVSNYQNNRNLYNRAYSTYLEGKGYAVK